MTLIPINFVTADSFLCHSLRFEISGISIAPSSELDLPLYGPFSELNNISKIISSQFGSTWPLH